MTTPQFILRTTRGTPVMTFDDQDRALAAREARRSHGVNPIVWKVVQTEERVA